MATLADLKTRIISETLRDDLSDDMAADLDLIVRKSIDQYANEPWWFNTVVTTVPCIAMNDHLPLPIGFRRIQDLYCVIGGVRYRMWVKSVGEILEKYSTPQIGQPSDYALDGAAVFLWPMPNTAWPLLFDMIVDVTPPLNSDTDSNIWTNQGQDLIVARSKLRLYRDYLSATLQDTRVINANNQEEEAYSRLRSETNRRIATGRVRPAW